MKYIYYILISFLVTYSLNADPLVLDGGVVTEVVKKDNAQITITSGNPLILNTTIATGDVIMQELKRSSTTAWDWNLRENADHLRLRSHVGGTPEDDYFEFNNAGDLTVTRKILTPQVFLTGSSNDDFISFFNGTGIIDLNIPASNNDGYEITLPATAPSGGDQIMSVAANGDLLFGKLVNANVASGAAIAGSKIETDNFDDGPHQFGSVAWPTSSIGKAAGRFGLLHSDFPILFIYSENDPVVADRGGEIVLGAGHTDANNSSATFVKIKGFKENGTSTDKATYLTIETTTSGGTSAEALRIDSSQNVVVGGGTTANAKLEVTSSAGNGGTIRASFNGANRADTTLILDPLNVKMRRENASTADLTISTENAGSWSGDGGEIIISPRGSISIKANSSGNGEILVRTDANCGIGNVCSEDVWTATNVAAGTNMANVSQQNDGQWQRVGNTVTASIAVNFDLTSSGEGTLSFDAPVSSSFTQSEDAVGTCVTQLGGSTPSPSAIIVAGSGSDNILVQLNYNTTLTGKRFYCHFTYEVK